MVGTDKLFWATCFVSSQNTELQALGLVAQVVRMSTQCTRLGVRSPVRAHMRSNQWMHNKWNNKLMFLSLPLPLSKNQEIKKNTELQQVLQAFYKWTNLYRLVNQVFIIIYKIKVISSYLLSSRSVNFC